MRWIGFLIVLVILTGGTLGAFVASAAGWGLPGLLEQPVNVRRLTRVAAKQAVIPEDPQVTTGPRRVNRVRERRVGSPPEVGGSAGYRKTAQCDRGTARERRARRRASTTRVDQRCGAGSGNMRLVAAWCAMSGTDTFATSCPTSRCRG